MVQGGVGSGVVVAYVHHGCERMASSVPTAVGSLGLGLPAGRVSRRGQPRLGPHAGAP